MKNIVYDGEKNKITLFSCIVSKELQVIKNILYKSTILKEN